MDKRGKNELSTKLKGTVVKANGGAEEEERLTGVAWLVQAALVR